MKTLDQLLQALWENYTHINAQAMDIQQLLIQKGETVVNDHIAFRTYDVPNIRVDDLAQHFLKFGYLECAQYDFEAKKLRAKHYEHPDSKYPRIFISELKTQCFSDQLQHVVNMLAGQVSRDQVKADDFLVAGRIWPTISWDTYLALKQESEYAAWMAVWGFRANHFTVLINELKSFDGIVDFNAFIKDNGFELNDSGGEIKGTPTDLLQQSSTRAHQVQVEFSDRTVSIPSCYYEFARRYPDADGNLFMGFITKSADKIFESTDNKGQ